MAPRVAIASIIAAAAAIHAVKAATAAHDPLLARAKAAGVPAKPHIFFLLVEDYGWAGADWHNGVESGGQREVQGS